MHARVGLSSKLTEVFYQKEGRQIVGIKRLVMHVDLGALTTGVLGDNFKDFFKN